jgi:hypothetical protein
MGFGLSGRKFNHLLWEYLASRGNKTGFINSELSEIHSKISAMGFGLSGKKILSFALGVLLLSMAAFTFSF